MEANIDLAKSLYSSGKYSEALPVLDHVMNIVTSNSELHEMRALCNIKSGDHIKVRSLAYLKLSKGHRRVTGECSYGQ